jgi:hypothetical protein
MSAGGLEQPHFCKLIRGERASGRGAPLVLDIAVKQLDETKIEGRAGVTFANGRCKLLGGGDVIPGSEQASYAPGRRSHSDRLLG